VCDSDWRINLVTTLTEDTVLPWNDQFIPKGTALTTVSVVSLNKKKHLNIPVPNATAICLKISHQRYNEAREIRENSRIDKSLKKTVTFNSDSDAICYIELMFESIIMAFTALEAFANEYIPEDYEIWEKKKNDIILEKKDKKDIERFSSTMDKFHRILPDVLGIDSPKGTKCWQNLVALKKIRDRVIHMKTDDRLSSGPEKSTIWNSIFRLEQPHKQAFSVVKYFVDSTKDKPRWYKKCEFKNL
jgi:hypothetical protein